MERIEIRLAGNGFIVTPNPHTLDKSRYASKKDTFVFETFESLVEWLKLNICDQKKEENQ